MHGREFLAGKLVWADQTQPVGGPNPTVQNRLPMTTTKKA
jgi:hypothetical protein